MLEVGFAYLSHFGTGSVWHTFAAFVLFLRKLLPIAAHALELLVDVLNVAPGLAWSRHRRLLHPILLNRLVLALKIQLGFLCLRKLPEPAEARTRIPS